MENSEIEEKLDKAIANFRKEPVNPETGLDVENNSLL